MNRIGAYDAKTHLPKLLERVEKGERFVITRHGRPVAELAPIAARDSASIRRGIAEMRRIRKALARRKSLSKNAAAAGESLRELAHENHRY